MYSKYVNIYVVWPRHWLNGHRVKALRSQFARVKGRCHGPVHNGECFVVDTQFGKIAIPLMCTRISVL